MESNCLGLYNGTYFVSGPLLQAASVAESASLSAGSFLAIAFLLLDVWKAFHRKQHWIPCDSFILGALTLLLLTLINMPSALFHFPQNGSLLEDAVYNIAKCSETISRRMAVLAGRVALCVVMGCMLPGLARPRSSALSLWADMAALIITCSAPILHLCNEIYVFVVVTFYLKFDLDTSTLNVKLLIVTFTLLVAFLTLILLLVSAALASISIHKIVSHKIPLILSNSTLERDYIVHISYSQSFWQRVEDQIVKSWIVVCTSNPQYIIARSVLSSSVAFVITVCNGVLVFEVVQREFTVNIHMVLHWLVILLGSGVIYWRWITSVVFCPTSMERKWASIRKHFQIEDFWKRYLVELKDGHKSHRQMGDSYLKKLLVNVGRRLRVHKLIPLAVWLQILLVLFSKVCWLVSQLLLCNMYLRKLLVGSAVEEFPDLYGGNGLREIELGNFSYHEKYSKAFVTMIGENIPCLWVANRKSIQGIERQMKRGQEEGQTCEQLIALLKNKSSSACKCSHPPKSVPTRLEVEKEFDIRQWRSCKMRVVSMITVIFELCPFTPDLKEFIEVLEACSQAWNIIDLVENPDTKAFQISKTADKLFQGLQKRSKSLSNNLRMSRCVENSSEAAREAVGNLVERAKRRAEEHRYRTWNEVVEGYSLWMVCENIDFEKFTKVEGIIDELVRMLADEISCCMAKALDVIMEDSQRWATMAMEQHIWIAAYIAGKVKSTIERSGWMLACNAEEDIDNASSSSTAFPALTKLPTFQIG